MDGIQFYQGEWFSLQNYLIANYSIGDNSYSPTGWLPDLTSRRWYVWVGTYNGRSEAAITNKRRPPKGCHPQDKWAPRPVHSGPWRTAWPVFLSYVEMIACVSSDG